MLNFFLICINLFIYFVKFQPMLFSSVQSSSRSCFLLTNFRIFCKVKPVPFIPRTFHVSTPCPTSRSWERENKILFLVFHKVHIYIHIWEDVWSEREWSASWLLSSLGTQNQQCCAKIELVYIYIYIYIYIDLVDELFANDSLDRGSIPGRVISKTQK